MGQLCVSFLHGRKQIVYSVCNRTYRPARSIARTAESIASYDRATRQQWALHKSNGLVKVLSGAAVLHWFRIEIQCVLAGAWKPLMKKNVFLSFCSEIYSDIISKCNESYGNPSHVKIVLCVCSFIWVCLFDF